MCRRAGFGAPRSLPSQPARACVRAASARQPSATQARSCRKAVDGVGDDSDTPAFGRDRWRRNDGAASFTGPGYIFLSDYGTGSCGVLRNVGRVFIRPRGDPASCVSQPSTVATGIAADDAMFSSARNRPRGHARHRASDATQRAPARRESTSKTTCGSHAVGASSRRVDASPLRPVAVMTTAQENGEHKPSCRRKIFFRFALGLPKNGPRGHEERRIGRLDTLAALTRTIRARDECVA